ncbi:MAG: hypothetical protein ACK5IJ_01340 [Mangrovibacterium sp.]
MKNYFDLLAYGAIIVLVLVLAHVKNDEQSFLHREVNLKSQGFISSSDSAAFENRMQLVRTNNDSIELVHLNNKLINVGKKR